MKTGSILLVFFLIWFHSFAQDVITITKTISRSYTGTVGQKTVHLNLAVAGNKAKGEYVFQGTSTPVELIGTLEDGKLSMSAIPDPNAGNDAGNNDGYIAKGQLAGSIDESGHISGSLQLPEATYNLNLNKIFEVSYVDTSLNAAYINHNTDFKTDTVYTVSLDELHFLNLPFKTKLRSLKYWYSIPLISLMAQNNYKELNSLGGVKLEEMGYIDGNYLLQQKKALRHPQFPYRYQKSYSVAYADQRLLSVESDLKVYDGAPHAYSNKTYKNFDLNTGDSLKLDSLFLRGGKYFLDSVGEICFRTQTGIGPNADLATLGYFWNDSFFHVNSNFFFTISGICFVYNTNEIASYNIGVTKFTIPYEMLKPIIRRRGPLGWVRNE